eukprot:5351638-Lingulodinium_polyedra.AAC.1
MALAEPANHEPRPSLHTRVPPPGKRTSCANMCCCTCPGTGQHSRAAPRAHPLRTSKGTGVTNGATSMTDVQRRLLSPSPS